jgi:hypothetical protein
VHCLVFLSSPFSVGLTQRGHAFCVYATSSCRFALKLYGFLGKELKLVLYVPG